MSFSIIFLELFKGQTFKFYLLIQNLNNIFIRICQVQSMNPPSVGFSQSKVDF